MKSTTPATDSDNPYTALARGWSDRLAKLERQNGALVITLLLLGLTTAALAAGTLYLAFFRLPSPYVVEVDAENRVRFGGWLTERLTERDGLVPSELADFVEFWRSVTPDNGMQQKLVRRLHCMVSANSPAFAEMREYYLDPASDPFVRNRSVSVEPGAISVLKLSGQTWAVEWEEVARAHTGEIVGEPVPFKANVIVSRGAVNGECTQSNPLGIYISQVSWTNAS